MSGQMYDTTYLAGGRYDAPFYPTFTVPFVVGMKEDVLSSQAKVMEYVVPFYGEIYAVGFDTSRYQNDDNWDLEINGEKICEKIYVKRAPEGINLQSFIPVAPGTKIKLTFRNVGGDKAMWATLQFLREGDLNYQLPTKPPGGLSPIKVDKKVIRLSLIDDGDEDGDRLSVYVNGAKLVNDLNLSHDKPSGSSVFGTHHIEVPLALGDNEILFEGISPGALGSPLTAKFRVCDDQWNVLYDIKDLPNLRMPATPVDDNHLYTTRPTVSWIVNRTV